MYTGPWIFFHVTSSKADMWVQMLKGERGSLQKLSSECLSFLGEGRNQIISEWEVNGKLIEEILEAKTETRCDIVIQESGKVAGLLKCGMTKRICGHNIKERAVNTVLSFFLMVFLHRYSYGKERLS